MSTLIAACNSDGCQGRCDAKCYGAHEPDCDCICGGRNHGAGQQQAIGNTREMAESWPEQARTDGQDITRAELAVTVTHEPLFDLADAGPTERQLEDWTSTTITPTAWPPATTWTVKREACARQHDGRNCHRHQQPGNARAPARVRGLR